MIECLQVYRCEYCGNMVEMIHVGGPVVVCCGKPMKLQDEKTADSSVEKHVPVIEKVEGGFSVKVGSVPHPMADDHYIEWIELTIGNLVGKYYLKPGDAPEVFFSCPDKDVSPSDLSAREYCNKHGLWRA